MQPQRRCTSRTERAYSLQAAG